jgi:hypothetical protein
MSVLRPGQSLAQRFVLVRRLGEGGMAEAWLAHDIELDEHVVAKVVSSSASPDRVALLRHECRQARRLVHPNIVRVFDFHRDEDTWFVTMEHVEGESIASMRGRAPAEIVEAMLPIVDALALAHRHGVVHRDLKAGNVLCDLSGRPRLLDFGISALLDPGPGDPILSGGGSRGHVSPQQGQGAKPQPSDDIYSLGVLIHELVTGRPPFPQGAEHTAVPPQSPPEMVSSHAVPPRLQALVRRMLAASPGDRPSDMTEVHAELDAIRREHASRGDADLAARLAPQGVRLTPPPRAEKVAAIAPDGRTTSGRGAEGATSRWLGWGTAMVVGLLGLAIVAVFVWLPRWAEALRGAPPATAVSASTPTAEGEPAPADSGPTPSTPPETPATSEPYPEPVDAMDDPPLDPAPKPVRSEAEPVPAPPAEDTAGFAAAMSAGLEAEARGDWAAARDAFSRAAGIRPESPEVVDAIVRVDLRHKLEVIAIHRVEAEQDEAVERWASAVEHYAAVLALDPTVRFAQEGRDRAGPRAALDDRLEFHIAHPDRLSADDVFEEATRLLATAEEIEPSGPKLRGQIDALGKLLQVAGTPVQVRLESDEQTDVIVYKVGHLGRFSEHRLTLRPGRYVVVGSRQGYRDVRLELVVVAGQPPGTLAVRCEEKI